MPQNLYASVANEVRAAFPGQFHVPLHDAAIFIGYAPKTARNLGDAFPLKTIKQGKLRMVPLPELVRHLSAQLEAAGIPDAVVPAMRDLSGRSMAPHQRTEGRSNSVLLQRDVPHHLAGRDRAGDAMRREGSRDRQAARGAGEFLTAGGSTPPIRRDAELAKRALESHQQGHKAPEGKALSKAIKAGDWRSVRDSTGRAYLQHKDGRVVCPALHQKVRQTESRNLNHLGLTSTKYVTADKRFLGIKYGSQILKSGGTLKAEAAGALRDKLHAATKGSSLAKIAAKPVDVALRKGEAWQKAGALESLGARAQMKMEETRQRGQVLRELKAKASGIEPKAAAQPKEAGRHAEMVKWRQELAKAMQREEIRQAPAKAGDLAKQRMEQAKDIGKQIREQAKASPAPIRTPAKSADLAKDLASRPAPTIERTTERTPESAKTQDRAWER